MVRKTSEEARQGTKGWPVMAVLVIGLALAIILMLVAYFAVGG